MPDEDEYAFIDIRITFEKELDEDYTHYNPVLVGMKETDIPSAGLAGIGESAFQSDKYTVDVANAVLSSLDGRTVDLTV